MNDLTERLKAALDEDERIIDGALNPTSTSLTYGDYAKLAEEEAFDERFDLERARRQTAAHRKILELHEPRAIPVLGYVEESQRKVAYEPTGAMRYTACPTCGGRDWDLERQEPYEPCDTVLALAEAYGIKP